MDGTSPTRDVLSSRARAFDSYRFPDASAVPLNPRVHARARMKRTRADTRPCLAKTIVPARRRVGYLNSLEDEGPFELRDNDAVTVGATKLDANVSVT